MDKYRLVKVTSSEGTVSYEIEEKFLWFFWKKTEDEFCANLGYAKFRVNQLNKQRKITYTRDLI